MADQVFEVTLNVVQALEACGVVYTIVGSPASRVGGEPRFTQDVDVLVDLHLHQVAPMIAALGTTFYADAEAIGRAIARRSSVNLIHIPTNIKIDLFVAGGSALDDGQLRRRERRQLAADRDAFAYFQSHEDILLQTLLRYRAGGEVSDRQWRDAQGIVLDQAHGLNRDYLDEVAARIGVSDLLARLFAP